MPEFVAGIFSSFGVEAVEQVAARGVGVDVALEIFVVGFKRVYEFHHFGEFDVFVVCGCVNQQRGLEFGGISSW